MEVVANAVLIYLEATVACVKMVISCIQINGIVEVGSETSGEHHYMKVHCLVATEREEFNPVVP